MEATKLLMLRLWEVVSAAVELIDPKAAVVPYATEELAASLLLQVMVAEEELGVPELMLEIVGTILSILKV